MLPLPSHTDTPTSPAQTLTPPVIHSAHSSAPASPSFHPQYEPPASPVSRTGIMPHALSIRDVELDISDTELLKLQAGRTGSSPSIAVSGLPAGIQVLSPRDPAPSSPAPVFAPAVPQPESSPGDSATVAPPVALSPAPPTASDIPDEEQRRGSFRRRQNLLDSSGRRNSARGSSALLLNQRSAAAKTPQSAQAAGPQPIKRTDTTSLHMQMIRAIEEIVLPVSATQAPPSRNDSTIRSPAVTALRSPFIAEASTISLGDLTMSPATRRRMVSESAAPSSSSTPSMLLGRAHIAESPTRALAGSPTLPSVIPEPVRAVTPSPEKPVSSATSEAADTALLVDAMESAIGALNGLTGNTEPRGSTPGTKERQMVTRFQYAVSAALRRLEAAAVEAEELQRTQTAEREASTLLEQYRRQAAAHEIETSSIKADSERRLKHMQEEHQIFVDQISEQNSQLRQTVDDLSTRNVLLEKAVAAHMLQIERAEEKLQKTLAQREQEEKEKQNDALAESYLQELEILRLRSTKLMAERDKAQKDALQASHEKANLQRQLESVTALLRGDPAALVAAATLAASSTRAESVSDSAAESTPKPESAESGGAAQPATPVHQIASARTRPAPLSTSSFIPTLTTTPVSAVSLATGTPGTVKEVRRLTNVELLSPRVDSNKIEAETEKETKARVGRSRSLSGSGKRPVAPPPTPFHQFLPPTLPETIDFSSVIRTHKSYLPLEGWLYKRSKGLMKQERKRYVVLKNWHLLSYEESSQMLPSQIIDLAHAQLVRHGPDSDAPPVSRERGGSTTDRFGRAPPPLAKDAIATTAPGSALSPSSSHPVLSPSGLLPMPASAANTAAVSAGAAPTMSHSTTTPTLAGASAAAAPAGAPGSSSAGPSSANPAAAASPQHHAFSAPHASASVTASSSANEPYSFDIFTPYRSYHFFCKTYEEYKTWTQAIQNDIEHATLLLRATMRSKNNSKQRQGYLLVQKGKELPEFRWVFVVDGQLGIFKEPKNLKKISLLDLSRSQISLPKDHRKCSLYITSTTETITLTTQNETEVELWYLSLSHVAHSVKTEVTTTIFWQGYLSRKSKYLGRKETVYAIIKNGHMRIYKDDMNTKKPLETFDLFRTKVTAYDDTSFEILFPPPDNRKLIWSALSKGDLSRAVVCMQQMIAFLEGAQQKAIRKGNLFKKEEDAVLGKESKYYFFVLTKDYLSYYVDKANARPKRLLPLVSAKIKLPPNYEQHYSFVFSTPEKTLLLYAANATDHVDWVEDIRQAIKAAKIEERRKLRKTQKRILTSTGMAKKSDRLQTLAVTILDSTHKPNEPLELPSKYNIAKLNEGREEKTDADMMSEPAFDENLMALLEGDFEYEEHRTKITRRNSLPLVIPSRRSDSAVVVIDNGSSFIRAGFGGEEMPRAVIPTCVAYRDTGSTLEYFVGHDAHREIDSTTDLTAIYPFAGNSQDLEWDPITDIYESLLSSHLRIDPTEHNFLLTQDLIHFFF
eukprot:TRINITY_DN166_c1_g1_i1.p1 TRINITY_DN166_c1_g1~~TRINITY_DN166_c1_g1_i1.p1  ORF type:complete len:1544 (-),score=386.21 TRINITY_DN166_c1_g1_i1:1-4473(-)